ncbi:hypothetical protein GX586_00555 [bacterium]|nr:hypothetical protein [bacterium]
MAACVDHDVHVHTYLSDCCADKEHHRPAAILALAREMGVRTIGFSDHVWMNPAIEPSGWYRKQDATQITRLREDLSAIRTPVRVLVGCEADMRAPGQFGITRDFAATLDYTLLSCSHFHMRDFVEQPAGDTPGDLARHLLSFFTSGVASGVATSIAHPFLPCGHMAQYDAIVAAISDAAFADAFGAAAANRVAIEVTCAFLPPDDGPRTWSIETPARMLSLAKRAGCRFTFGSDAHCAEHQRKLPLLGRLIDVVGIGVEDVHPLVRP